MRHLGIDYGAKNVGLAISDEIGDFSYPHKVLDNSKDLVKDIAVVCKDNNIGTIILGESKDFSQKENKIMEEIKIFKKELENVLKIPVHLHPEFLTSREAERLQGSNKMHDASAAALILKSYLDTNKNHGQ